MSTVGARRVLDRLTRERMRSYLEASADDPERALVLYDWNLAMSAALYEDIGRFEVLLRNAMERELQRLAEGGGLRWYDRAALFPGKSGARTLEDIDKARRRATRRRRPEVHGKVIAELPLGFWRYLCSGSYLTSLWVPALSNAFPNHPNVRDARVVRSAVDDRVQRIHVLRNRIAHHEPIHQRDLRRDLEGIRQVAGWICVDTQAWIDARSRSAEVLLLRP